MSATSIRAIAIQAPGKAEIKTVSAPKLRPDYILVKPHALALNPTDWKHVDWLADPKNPGARVGCDYSGTVLEVGSAVTKPFKVGDRVAGFCHGGNAVYIEDGAFGEVITAKGDIQIKIPDNLSFEEASTLGVGITTVGQGLYQSLKLPPPSAPAKEKFPLLIYGGSTATGSLAIQFAKLSGLEVIVTCSPHNADYCKSLGADKVFDYKSPTCSQDIKEYTNNKLKHAFDCISEGDSTKITVASMSDEGGVYSTLLTVDKDVVAKTNPKVTEQMTLGYTVVGEEFNFGPTTFKAKPEDFEFGKKWWETASELLAQGKIKVHRPSVNEHGSGLEGVMKGMQAMKEGKVSGKKLVYTL